MQIPVGQLIDIRTGRLTARFEGEGSGGKYTANRFVAQCVLSCGMAPSYAFATVPVAQFGPGAYDQKGLKVAMKAAGPAGKLRLLSRAQVLYEENGQDATLMTGWLVSNSHIINTREDSVIMQIFDDKIIFDKITVSGCLCYDPARQTYYWDLKRKCIFNELGWPNFIDSPLGAVFAPCHRFGYQDSFRQGFFSDQAALDTSEPKKGQAFTRSRSADCDDAIKYLRLVHWLGKTNMLPPLPIDVGLTTLPYYIGWPADLGHAFGTGARRILKHESMQGADGKGMGLGLAIQTICRKAGAFDFYLKPAQGFNSELTLIDLNPGRAATTQLLLPDYDPGIRNCFPGNAIKEGHITESAVDYFHEDCMEGDGPAIEGMITMPLNDDLLAVAGATIDGIPAGLDAAWSTIDQLLALDYVASHLGAGPTFDNYNEALNQAFDLYPWWMCAYKITNGYNPWKGTKWDGMMNGGRMRFRPFLNTGYQMDSGSPSNWQPREIIVEMFIDQTREYDYNAWIAQENADNPDADPQFPPSQRLWYRCNRFDNLTLSADSTVAIFSALRANFQSFYLKDVRDSNGDADGSSPITRLHHRPMRINCALEADWPITGRKGKADPNNTALRVNQQFKYCWRVAAPAGDYQELLRRGDSYPVGKASGADASHGSFPPKCTTGNELFTDRVDENTGILPDHATTRLADVKRVPYLASLRIPRLVPSMRPGLSVEVLGSKTIKCTGVLKSVKFAMTGTTCDPAESPAVPDTWLEMGPPDMAVLMPEPTAGHAIVTSSPENYSGSDQPPSSPPPETSAPPSAPPPETTAPPPAQAPGDDYERAEAAAKQAPVAAKQAPAAAKQEPAAEKQAPAAEKQAPAAKKQAPAAKKQAPAAKKQAPVAPGAQPVAAPPAQAPAKEASSSSGEVSARKAHMDERNARLKSKKKAQAIERASDKLAQRRGIAGRSTDTGGFGLGKSNSGSITRPGGEPQDNIADALMGKAGSGSISMRGGEPQDNIMHAMFGKPGLGGMTPGAPGGSHREWDTDSTKAGKKKHGGGAAAGPAPKTKGANEDDRWKTESDKDFNKRLADQRARGLADQRVRELADNNDTFKQSQIEAARNIVKPAATVRNAPAKRGREPDDE